MPIIQADGISKCFRIYRHPSDHLKELLSLRRRRYHEPFWAVKGVDLRVERGTCLGIIGQNGSGKSTLLRMLAGVIRPTEGSARILGMDTRRQSVAIKRHIGNLPSEAQLWDHLTGEQVIRYLCDLRPGCDWRYANQLAERLHLDLTIRTRDYSTGNRRKLGLIQALMHRPALLILDEPTQGLAESEIAQLCTLVRAIAQRATVLLIEHNMEVVLSLAGRVTVMDAGSIIAEGTPAEIARDSAVQKAYLGR